MLRDTRIGTYNAALATLVQGWASADSNHSYPFTVISALERQPTPGEFLTLYKQVCAKAAGPPYYILLQGDKPYKPLSVSDPPGLANMTRLVRELAPLYTHATCCIKSPEPPPAADAPSRGYKRR